MAAKKSKLAAAIVKHADAINLGLTISIDPSSGSKGSLPGYALWNAGKLMEYGCLRIPPGTRATHQRLYLLRQALERLPRPNLVITEQIGSGMGLGRPGGHAVSGALQKAVGVIMAQWDVPVLEVSPATWKSHIDKDLYVKSDPQDAVILFCSARRVLEREQGISETPLIYIEGELKNV